jgi:hypothetical protein
VLPQVDSVHSHLIEISIFRPHQHTDAVQDVVQGRAVRIVGAPPHVAFIINQHMYIVSYQWLLPASSYARGVVVS